jgi:glycosyltransferase involved in cell wall biosynthesis
MKCDITLCMIVKDEEKRLEACLASAAEYVEEMIIVDTGSTDNTREIALRYGATVIQAPWENDFAKARNAGLELATKQWILCLDADERLAPPLNGYLSYLTKQEDVHGYYVKMISFIGDSANGESMTDEACRLFRNDPRIRFSRPIHEQVIPSLLALPGACLLRSELTVLHEGYLNAVIAEKKKNERNTAILQAALRCDPDDPEYRYAYGTELYQQQKYDEALQFFLPLLGEYGECPGFEPGSGQTADLIQKTAYTLNITGQTEAAILLLRQAMEQHTGNCELLELLAGLYVEYRRPAEAVPLLDKAIEAFSLAVNFSTLSGSGSYRSQHLAGMAYEGLWMFGEAVARYASALSLRPNYAPSWSRLPLLALITGHEEQLADLLSELHSRVPPDIWISIVHETLYIRKDDFAEKVWKIAPKTVWKRYYPLWKGIVLAREDADAAYRLIDGLDVCAEAQWYLWAIRVKLGQTESMDLITPPSFSLGMKDPVYRRCQDVLLQVGAWDALPRLMYCFPPDAAFPMLPVHRFYAYLTAPDDAIESLLRSAIQQRGNFNLTSRNSMVLGSLAVHAGKLRQASEWFHYSHLCDPALLEAAAGFLFSSRLLARQQLPARLSDIILEEDELAPSIRTIRGFLIQPG